MSNLKILVPYPNSFDTISNTSLIIRSLLPVLKKKIDVEILWVSYQSEKLPPNTKNESEIRILDLHNYNNALDLLTKEKPDIIYVSPYPEFIHYSFSLAGKFLGIPTINLLYYDLTMSNERPRTKLFFSYLRRFFQNSIPTEKSYKKHKIFRRGRYIFYKLIFFIKTLFAIKIPFFKIVNEVIYLFRYPLLTSGILEPRFALTKHYLQNEIILENFLKRNYDRSCLLVTGNPMFDKFFIKKPTNLISKEKENKIKILIAPDSFYEFGIWTKSQRSEILKKIINEINKEKDHFSIIVKIHPSAATLDDYTEIVNSIDETIPVFQKGGIEDYLDQIDLVISYSSESTGLIYSLLAKKPIIIFNFFNDKIVDIIAKNLISECSSSDSLLTIIKNILLENPISDENLSNYITKFLFKGDGLAGKRICDDIFCLINKKQS